MTNEPFTAPAHANRQPLTAHAPWIPGEKTPTSRRLR
jgi:hypothetical protein